MKIVVAIEGMDGAGKSTLSRFMQELCEQRSRTCTRIGRRTGYLVPAIPQLTQLLAQESPDLTPQAGVYLRVAREFLRAHLAASAPPGLVLLDRFVLSVLSLARINGQDLDPLTQLLKEIVFRADLHATVFVKCPFEVAWDRVKARNQGLSPRNARGERLVRMMADCLEEDFHRGNLTGQRWLVDNSKSLSDAKEQLESFILPYFDGR
jgi:thymidylate kinase